MTHKEWKELTPYQKRIKVAELDGYSFVNEPIDEWVARYEDNIGDLPVNALVGRRNNNGLDLVPDYLNDLNATHELELYIQKIGSDKWLDYIDILRHVTFSWGGAGAEISATASERAEAFYLTIDGWTWKREKEGE